MWAPWRTHHVHGVLRWPGVEPATKPDQFIAGAAPGNFRKRKQSRIVPQQKKTCTISEAVQPLCACVFLRVCVNRFRESVFTWLQPAVAPSAWTLQGDAITLFSFTFWRCSRDCAGSNMMRSVHKRLTQWGKVQCPPDGFSFKFCFYECFWFTSCSPSFVWQFSQTLFKGTVHNKVNPNTLNINKPNINSTNQKYPQVRYKAKPELNVLTDTIWCYRWLVQKTGSKMTLAT